MRAHENEEGLRLAQLRLATFNPADYLDGVAETKMFLHSISIYKSWSNLNTNPDQTGWTLKRSRI